MEGMTRDRVMPSSHRPLRIVAVSGGLQPLAGHPPGQHLLGVIGATASIANTI